MLEGGAYAGGQTRIENADIVSFLYECMWAILSNRRARLWSRLCDASMSLIACVVVSTDLNWPGSRWIGSRAWADWADWDKCVQGICLQRNVLICISY